MIWLAPRNDWIFFCFEVSCSRIAGAIKLRFKTCFISASFGVDTSVVRRNLQARGIRWSDQTSLQTDLNLAEAVDKAITSSDFVCIIIPEGEQANILFELGIAYARRKPILAFIGKSAHPPADLLSLTYFRVDPSEVEAVDYALGTFLTHASDQPLGEVSIPRSKRDSSLGAALFVSSPGTALGSEFQRRTEELLKKAGFIVSQPLERNDRNQGADLAVWIEELQNYSLGNPLLVDVKVGDLTQSQIHDAALQLRSYVEKTQGRSGLLIYWDRQNREFPSIEKGWPIIFQLSGETLTRLLREERLPEELVRLRNAAVHGEV